LNIVEVQASGVLSTGPDPELYDQETGCPIQIQDNILKRHSLHWKAPSDRSHKACECTSDDACHGSEYNVPQKAWELWKLEPSKVAVCYKPENAIGNGHCRCENEKEQTRACVGKGALLSTQDRRNKYMDMQGLPKGAKRCATQSMTAKCRCSGSGKHTIWYGANYQWKSLPASKSGIRCTWKVFGWVRHSSAGARACYCVEGDNPAPTPAPTPAPKPKPQEPKPQELGADLEALPQGAKLCAKEHEQCECQGTIHYGAKGKWKTKPAKGKVGCDNSVFGDPIEKVKKACYCVSGDKVAPASASRPRHSKHSIFSKAHKLASKLR
jgi:hypothetical protein